MLNIVFENLHPLFSINQLKIWQFQTIFCYFAAVLVIKIRKNNVYAKKFGYSRITRKSEND